MLQRIFLIVLFYPSAIMSFAQSPTLNEAFQPSFLFIPFTDANTNLKSAWDNNPNGRFAIEQLFEAVTELNLPVLDFETILKNTELEPILKNTASPPKMKEVFLDKSGADIFVEVSVKTIPKFGNTVGQVTLKSFLTASKEILIPSITCESPPFNSNVTPTELLNRAIKDNHFECLQNFINETLAKFHNKVGDNKIVDLTIQLNEYANPSWNLYTEIKECKKENKVVTFNRRLSEVIDWWIQESNYRNLTRNKIATSEKLNRKILIPKDQSLDRIGRDLQDFLNTLESSELIPRPKFPYQIIENSIIVELY